MSKDRQTYQRATSAALAGLAVQLIVALALLLLALWSQNAALAAATWYAFGGVGLWACLWVLYQQHRLERTEALEAEQLAARHGTDSSIFETTADDLSVARRRLDGLYKWFVPIVSLITAGYLIGVGAWLTSGYSDRLEILSVLAERASPLAMAFILAAAAFIGFLVSRFVAGMAKNEQWQLLRGGAAYLRGVTLILAALAVTMFTVAGFDARAALKYLAVLVPAFMALVGVEIALNFVLDLYRPRKPGERPRPAFDSRILSLLTTPESIAKTINEAINYQFGFEITRSWFWQLLSRTFGWLVLFAALVLLAMSCLVLVQPHERALVTRFGSLVEQPLEPGLHLKLPWPASQAETYDVSRIRTLRIGSEVELRHDVPILWSNEHARQEPTLLIVAPPSEDRGVGPDEQLNEAEQEELARAAEAAEKAARDEAEEAAADVTGESAGVPSVSLVNAEIGVQYRIDPERLVRYVWASADTDAEQRDHRLQNIAEQEVSRYLLRYSIDRWIGTARQDAGDRLRQIIQRAADRAGVEVLSVNVVSIHPPSQVADAFHEVVGAEQEKQQKIEQARKHEIQTLAEVAGSAEQANAIVREIEKLEKLKNKDASDAEIAEQERRIERRVREAGGTAAVEIAEARGYRWEKENTERGEALRFSKRLQGYNNAPDYYRTRHMHDVLSEGLQTPRKFLNASEYGELDIRGDIQTPEESFSDALDAAAQRESQR
jgi:regulator of protease activity HflC (stomatin/prohibitin superfamily)